MTLNLTVPDASGLDGAGWTLCIADAWNASREAVIHVGSLLIEAKAALPHGEFEAMVETNLPFGKRTAQCLMAIGRDQRIANTKYVALLPVSWSTLYELTRLDDATLSGAFEAGKIKTDMVRADVKRLGALVAAGDGAGGAGLDGAQCAIEDLNALAASGKARFGAILADPAWTFETYSAQGKDRSAERHYPCMTDQEIAALPIKELCADDCVLFLWCTGPKLEDALWVIGQWGFDYKTMGFTWAKEGRKGGSWWKGMGFWTRSNPEFCLLATRGAPKRLDADVEELIVAPVREHSRKPADTRKRIFRLVGGPYLELFARSHAEGWDAWGAEVGKFADDDDRATAPAKPPGKFADPAKPAERKPKPAGTYQRKHGPPAKAKAPAKAKVKPKAPVKVRIRHAAALKPSPDVARIEAAQK